mmetsp:Transcript_7679/g.6945  ORF Transcript_7679/g.6945 Transcript_7679/m.6945 type:complete len:118 (-) Transcript_7679:205-558(-)
MQFTPFYVKAARKKIPKPNMEVPTNFINESQKFECEFTGNVHEFYEPNPDIELHGGRKLGVELLEKIPQHNEYSKKRVNPLYETTKLSAHIKFGTLSVREIYWKVVDTFNKHHELIR